MSLNANFWLILSFFFLQLSYNDTESWLLTPKKINEQSESCQLFQNISYSNEYYRFLFNQVKANKKIKKTTCIIKYVVNLINLTHLHNDD